MTDNTPGACDWIPCHCCGKTFPDENVVSLQSHPGDAICIDCAAWIYNQSRPIARRLSPVWQLPPRVRTFIRRTR
jgi:hypothetical protein